MSPHIEETPSPSACECPLFDRKSAMPSIERRIADIARDIEGFSVDIIADLLSNAVGSDKALAAVKRAKDYSTLTGTRFILGGADQDIVLDTFKAVDQHSAANKGSIHPNGWQRAVMSRAANSKCPEYFSEVKQSNTTGLKELYVARRIGQYNDNIVSVIRGSKAANPF